MAITCNSKKSVNGQSQVGTTIKSKKSSGPAHTKRGVAAKAAATKPNSAKKSVRVPRAQTPLPEATPEVIAKSMRRTKNSNKGPLVIPATDPPRQHKPRPPTGLLAEALKRVGLSNYLLYTC